MAKLAGQKLRASYVSGTAAGQKLLASNLPAAANAVAGKPVKASQIP